VRTSNYRKADGGVALGSEKNKTRNDLRQKNYNSADSIQVENNENSSSIKKAPRKGEHNS